MISCPYCNSNQYYKSGINNKGYQRYECRQCNRKYTLETKPRAKPGTRLVIKACAECGKQTTNPKFCSSSCAASNMNRIIPRKKRKPTFCKHCGIQIHVKKGQRRTVCDVCNSVDWSQRTMGQMRAITKYHPHAPLRDLARSAFKQSGRPRVCQNCGYDTHVEICHIRAIQDFPDDTPVSVVSGIDNLVALCPNCHWEFDRGRLRYEDIPDV